MFTSGDRAGWLQTVASKIMGGGDNPPSIERLNLIVPRDVVTAPNDGHVTAARALGEEARQDYRAGWRVIISEMVGVLREQGFVGGSDDALTWLKPIDGSWRVAMPDDPGRELTIFGQRELRMSRDRMIIGERSEEDGSRVGVPSLFESGRIHPLELQVLGPRGGITIERFELHPLAIALPPMTITERENLRTSIERDGVKVPVVIFEKKILDGRHRSYFASVLNKPISIEKFEGSEEEARRYVAILNLHRRHLNAAQRYLTTLKLFGAQAEQEAKEALEQGRSYGQKGKPPNSVLEPAPSSEPDYTGRWHQRVAKLATEAGIPGITPAGMRSIKEVTGAPETIRKIESGEITSVAKAVRSAHDEKNLPPSPHVYGVNTVTVFKRLGSCIENLSQIIVDCEMDVGRGMPLEISARLSEIHRLASDVEQILRERKIIP